MKKPRRHLEFGVPAYWVVDPFEGVVRMWDAERGPDAPHSEARIARWRMAGAVAPFELDVQKVVAPL